jgi:hypothetical protein
MKELVTSPRPHEYLDVQLSLKAGIGETLVVLTIFHGAEINIFQLIADHVGLMDQLVRLLIESTLPEKNLARYATLSPQVIVNCQAGGSCNGGNPGEVYAYANKARYP